MQARKTGLNIARRIIMKHFNTQLSAGRIAGTVSAAILGIGLAASTMGQPSVQGEVLGTPNDGMLCRTGYSGAFSNGNLKCSKSRFFFVSLACDDSTFPSYVVRPKGSPGTKNGRDICTRKDGVRISSTDDVGDLTPGQEYVFAKLNDTALASEAARLDQEEAAALGLNATRDVDSIAGEPVIQPHPETGAKDRGVVQLVHYTFAIPTGSPVLARR